MAEIDRIGDSRLNVGLAECLGRCVSRRSALGGLAGLGSLWAPAFVGKTNGAEQTSAPSDAISAGRAKKCIILFCWGGISHIDTWDLKPQAPAEIRGLFSPIATNVPGIQIGEHLPRLARHMDKLAVIRSIHHDDFAHGRGMYWNLTGHRPPRVGNIPPMRDDWPSLLAMVSQFRAAPRGIPSSVRLPYPLVDNNTLQAGEYGGWLGVQHDPIVMRPASGEPYGGVSRDLGSAVINPQEADIPRITARRRLLGSLDVAKPVARTEAMSETRSEAGYEHFHDLAGQILTGSAIRDACNLDLEEPRVRELYGPHLGGTSALMARRLTEAGVPIVQVCCAAGDLNGASGDMYDTHGDNFNRLQNRLLPVFDRAASALLQDLSDRGALDETLVAILTDFGRTPRINGAAGRDHYPSVYSVVLAGGGIQGGQVYGSSDSQGAFPQSQACAPPDIHATIFQAMGISHRAHIHDLLGRPLPMCDGEPLPLF